MIKQNISILQLGKFYPPPYGGMETVLQDITEGFNEIGITCDVLCANDKAKTEIFQINGFKVIKAQSIGRWLGTSISPSLVYWLFKIQKKYSVIQVHFPNPLAVFAILLTRPKGKIVIHWHSDIIKQKYTKILINPFQNLVIKKAALIVGATEAHLKKSEQVNLFKNKEKIIPYGLNPKNLKSEKTILTPSILTEYQNRKIIFSLGRLVYYKGFEYLIESAKYIPDEYIILIGGSGPLYGSLNEKIKKYDLGNKVKLLGNIPQELIPLYYKYCKLFCLPSIFKSEMFGVVQLESFYFGKPVVSVNIPESGVPFVNIHGETGLCVDPKNPQKLAQSFIEIIEDPNLYTKFSNNAKRKIDEIYNMKTVMKAFEATFKNL